MTAEFLRPDEWRDLTRVERWLSDGNVPDSYLGDPGDSDTPLHRAVRFGTPDAVAALVARAREVDLPDEFGHTPLWSAVAHGQADSVRALLAAGADPWRPGVDHWTPGRLALTTELAPLFEELPGAVPLTAAERREQERADRLIAVFGERELFTEGLDVTFVAGLDEDAVIRRLGADPADFPVRAQDQADLEELTYGRAAFGLTGVTGGCMISGLYAAAPDHKDAQRRISRGTTAYHVFFNPKGGTFGTRYRDGAEDAYEEIGLSPFPGTPAGHWLYRFWQRSGRFPYGANVLAYACAAGGITEPENAWGLSVGPRRMVVPPPRS
ncbi:ankyrin repeat domain-containing protein [Streptomyces sp. NPDC000410]|uniref:ankyrin repeat domain-containing protein n=1 Tax=Streptomyces sp. NPDC000410 TaxID=3154254 RepID=UPI003327E8DC